MPYILLVYVGNESVKAWKENLCFQDRILTIAISMSTRAKTLIPDLVECELSSWLNMDIKFYSAKFIQPENEMKQNRQTGCFSR